MRCLLTGITGQVGGALNARLQSIGTIVAADRALLDLTRPAAIEPLLDQIVPDIIINPAAYTAVDNAEAEAELAMVVNGQAPGVIAGWAARHHVPFIHFSTDYVFSGLGEKRWLEDDATVPLSIYGASKLAGENAIRAAGGCFLIVRTSWVYASRGANFLRTIVRLASERRELRIVADQVGAPTPAALIADVMGRTFEGGLDNLCSRMAMAKGHLHLATSGETSWYGFATAIVDGLRRRGAHLAVERIIPIRSDEYPTKARRPLNSRLDLARLRQVFGITPPDWESALAAELDAIAEEIGRNSAAMSGRD